MPQIIGPAILLDIVGKAVTEVARDPFTAIPASAAETVSRQVRSAAARQLAEAPAMQHATNTEPWYRSRVTLGALVSILSSLALLAGYTIEPDQQRMLVEFALWAGGAGPLLGGLLALYGRWRARTPIGG